MVPANGTVVHDDIPGPKGHSLDLNMREVSPGPLARGLLGQPTFFTSNLFLPSSFLLAASAGCLLVDGPGASVMSTSAMVSDASFGP